METIKLGNVKVRVEPENIVVHGTNWEYQLNNADKEKVFQLVSKGDLHEAAHKALSAYYTFCNHFQSC
jgi:hypothetical protein